MDVLQTKKRGGVVRLACKPHELVVAGSNPAPASNYSIPKWIPTTIPKLLRNIIVAVYRCKNQRNNVEKTGLNRASFLKIRIIAMYSFFDTPPSGLAASNVPVFNIPSYGGV